MRGLLSKFFSRPAGSSNHVTTDPTVTLDYGTFKGKNVQETTSYLGIPFGQAKRFEVATLFSKQLDGVQDATKYGSISPQMKTDLYDGIKFMGIKLETISGLLFKSPYQHETEDCLNINVQVPLGTLPGAKLPVAFFIHGGGYLLGSGDISGKGTGEDGINLVTKSIEMKQPIIFVSANHRLNIFGLLAGKELMEAGASNLLLRDQRLAMEWVQKYISNFGGDPTKVTLIGGSAGAFATSMHLLLNDGNPEGLFRGAMMISGGANRLAPQTSGQALFDALAKFCNCDQAQDKLAQLKEVPEQMIRDFMSTLPNPSSRGIAVPFNPRPDGTYLKDSPFDMVRQGKLADIPIIIGDVKDEGTILSLIIQARLKTDAQIKQWLKTVLFPYATDDEIDTLLELYPSDPKEGSPFDTGTSNRLSPQYKRLAAIQGDAWFHCGRRNLLDHAPNRNEWTYQVETTLPLVGSRIPIVGSVHGSDVSFHMFGSDMSRNTSVVQSTTINFVNNLDPNSEGCEERHWPRYTSEGKEMYLIKNSGPEVIRDDFRRKQIDFLAKTDNFCF